MTKTVQLPRETRSVEVRAGSFDEAANTIDIVWTTGASVRRYDWRSGTAYDEVLEVKPGSVRLERLNAGAPFLNTHSSYELADVIGSVVPGSAKIEGGRGVATILLSRAAGDADIVQKIRDGVIRNVSAGYIRHQIEKTESDDGAVAVWRVTDWEPLEISAVPIPADPGAQTRSATAGDLFPCVVTQAQPDPAPEAASASQAPPHQEQTMADRANDTAAADAASVETPVIETRAAPAAPPADTAAQRAAALAAERTRAATIRDLGRRAGIKQEDVDAALDGDTSVEDFRSRAFDVMATRAEQVPTGQGARARIVGATDEEKRGEAIESALLHRFDPRTELSEHGRQYRGMTLLEMGRDMLEAHNVRTRGMSKHELAAEMLTPRGLVGDFSVRAGGLHSTSDFPNVLANVANKTLRAGYQAAPQTFRPLVRVVTLADFKQVSRVQLGEAPQLEKVNEHGEFKRGTLGEGAEKYALSTYGKIIGITRQVLINDDLDAFTRVPRSFGVAAANLESDLVWAQITSNPVMGDGTTLFHANHGNLGTGGAIGASSVGEGRKLMRKQKGVDKKTLINVVPVYLVVPSALETSAEQFLSPIYPAQTSNVVTPTMQKLVPIAEPRLDAASETAWYLAGSPDQIDIIELAYLEGQQGLFTETRMGFEVDGMEVKVRQDVAAKVIDHRGLLKNAGA